MVVSLSFMVLGPMVSTDGFPLCIQDVEADASHHLRVHPESIQLGPEDFKDESACSYIGGRHEVDG
jgi:hypothetical protein